MPPKFSKNQMDQPWREDRPTLIALIVEAWCDNNPEVPLQYSMPQLGMMAEAALIKAERYRLDGVAEMQAFATLMWLYGPNFDDVAEIQKILSSKAKGEAKIGKLFGDVSDAAWDKADSIRDEGQWVQIVAEA